MSQLIRNQLRIHTGFPGKVEHGPVVNDVPTGLSKAEPSVPSELHDRNQDLWRPLLAIADLAGGDWPMRARQAAREISGMAREDGSAPVQLLADLKTIFEQAQMERLSSLQVVTELAEMEGRPWAEWRQGKPITPNQLARTIAPFGVRPRLIRLNADEVARGYVIEDFVEAFSRYLSHTPACETLHRYKTETTWVAAERTKDEAALDSSFS